MSKTLTFNPILAVDSYKLCHAYAYPPEVRGMFSYIEARTGGRDILIPFGLQIWLKEFLTVPITVEHINEAESFAKLHGEPFNRSAWMKVVVWHRGFLPLVIRAVPEGTPVRSGNAIVTVQCDDPELFWLTSYIETALLRAVWYPTTIASLDFNTKQEMKRFYEIAGADLGFLPFALHDFGARGVTSSEQARVGGAAHLVNFMGSDNIEGIRAANFYYSEQMAGFSVRATEHSVACSFGLSSEDEIRYINHQLTVFEGLGNIISMVGDTKDIYRFAEHLCTTFRDRIIDLNERLGMKVVCRPDSGDALEVVPRLMRLFCSSFPTTKTSKGYIKMYPGIGILQGDGIDRMTVKTILGNVMAANYSPDNIVFGSGGGLLQKVNRDTLKFAMKASAIKVRQPAKDPIYNGEVRDVWVGIVKDPITDPGKKSKEGVLTLVRSRMTGQLQTARTDLGKLYGEFEDVMVTVYDKGVIMNETTLVEVRARAAV